MTACGAVGALMVAGRVVGQIRCELNIGHNSDYLTPDEWMPHTITLEWTPEDSPDLDLFDPAEHFDLDVPLGTAGPLCEVKTCVRRAGHDGLHDDIVAD